jgi:hypothetical protein
MMIRLITFADDRFGRKDGKYRQTQKKLNEMLSKHPDISSMCHYTDEDLVRTKWHEENAEFLSGGPSLTQSAGNAQKAYFIKHELENLPNGRFLLYHDTSPEVWQEDDYAQISLQPHLEKCEENAGILVGWWKSMVKWRHTHHRVTSPVCLRLMEAEQFASELQWCTSWILFKNSPYIRELVDEWFKYNCIPDCASYIRNKEADKKENSDFYENRGDQSILTLIMLKRDHTAVLETQNKNVFSIIDPVRYDSK